MSKQNTHGQQCCWIYLTFLSASVGLRLCVFRADLIKWAQSEENAKEATPEKTELYIYSKHDAISACALARPHNRAESQLNPKSECRIEVRKTKKNLFILFFSLQYPTLFSLIRLVCPYVWQKTERSKDGDATPLNHKPVVGIQIVELKFQ